MTQTNDVCTLTVAGVTTKMSGSYSCVATNTAGTAKCSALVTVTGKQDSVTLYIFYSSGVLTLYCGS